MLPELVVSLILSFAVVSHSAAVVEEVIVPSVVKPREAVESPVTRSSQVEQSSTNFSLEELMLLLDAAEKVQKKPGADDEGSTDSNFQHRLKQIIQTARTAAGSGRGTGSEFLDQAIRQVRARVNANGGTQVPDSSIFDAVVSQLGTGGKTPPNVGDESFLSGVLARINPQASTTPAPDNSFLGGLLRDIANKDPNTGYLDVLVKQVVPTTTTTTTTTTPPPGLQILDGLIKAYKNRNGGGDVDQRSGGDQGPAQSSAIPSANVLAEGLQNLLKQIQGGTTPNNQGTGSPSQPQAAGSGNAILEGLLKQFSNLQNRGGQPSADSGQPSSPASSGQSSQQPDLSTLENLFKQIQSRLSSTTTTPSPQGEGLEGFEGLIPVGGGGVQAPARGGGVQAPATPQQASPDIHTVTTTPASTRSQIENIFSGLVKDANSQGVQDAGKNFLGSLGKLLQKNQG